MSSGRMCFLCKSEVFSVYKKQGTPREREKKRDSEQVDEGSGDYETEKGDDDGLKKKKKEK